MNQIIGIAFGGAFGSVLRFLIASGVYQWLGRSFPYGTLIVNVIGCFLIGFLTEILVLQRLTFAGEYRAALLIGVLGGMTTFSTFSLETIYLLEQGNFSKAGLNILSSLGICLMATWLGLWGGRLLFFYSGTVFHTTGWLFPYALVIANALTAFLIGFIIALLFNKIELSIEHRAAILVLIPGIFILLSSLYLLLFLLEEGLFFEIKRNVILLIFMANLAICGITLWLGLLIGKYV